MKLYYVYILKCSDETYYTGMTNNVERRMREDEGGRNPASYTFSRRPLTLEFVAEFTNPFIAIEREKQFKNWSRKKKQALINDQFKLLPNLAKKKFKKNQEVQTLSFSIPGFPLRYKPDSNCR